LYFRRDERVPENSLSQYSVGIIDLLTTWELFVAVHPFIAFYIIGVEFIADGIRGSNVWMLQHSFGWSIIASDLLVLMK
jgi:hypothetical protein